MTEDEINEKVADYFQSLTAKIKDYNSGNCDASPEVSAATNKSIDLYFRLKAEQKANSMQLSLF